ncbi:MAG: hypothetical protein H6R18_2356 [Proteobacteria bacterium]|nr:hypothetical protein [Pseudomonadota bacterium]
MSTNTPPDAYLRQLTGLANIIQQAADNQQWDELNAALVRFDTLALAVNVKKHQKTQLQSIADTIDQARQLVVERRDEIGQLLDGLSGKR